MRSPSWALALIVASACYKPSFDNCTIDCDSPGACPSGLTCDTTMHLCSSSGSCAAPDASAGDSDGSGGSNSDGKTACWPFAVSNFDPCMLGATTPMPAAIDADNASCTTPAGGPDVCLIHVASFDVEGGLTVTGLRPVIIVSDGDVLVNAPIVYNGANSAAAAACTATSPGVSPSLAPGGGGGGHAQAGADGGVGGGDAGGSGGMTTGGDQLEPLELGCPGADGGGASPLNGVGGPGGGALQITSKLTITIASAVTVNGSGGSGGGYSAGFMIDGGGGGGGAGGSILLEADRLHLDGAAEVCAVGGGGGQGCSTTRTRGVDGGTAPDCIRPDGGGNAGFDGSGGSGGAGSAAAPQPGGASSGTLAAGGGGGGAGRITFHVPDGVASDSGAQVVPGPISR